MLNISKKLVLAALLVTTVSLGACQNTIHGAGRDIENAGESVQDTVD